jgi:hypothetical protein
MSGPLPVAAPQRVHDRIREASDGPREVVHASNTAVYVDLDGWCLGLVSATATRVPCALWSTLPDLDVLDPVVRVHRGELVVGDRPVRVARLADPRVSRVVRHDGGTDPHPHATTAALELPEDGRLSEVDLDRLLGRGPGLTPLGDDVLAGWFTTRAALGRPDEALAAATRRRLGATTLLSATLLDCAIRGEALPELAEWLAATSGVGLLAGARLALASIEDHTTPRRTAA